MSVSFAKKVKDESMEDEGKQVQNETSKPEKIGLYREAAISW